MSVLVMSILTAVAGPVRVIDPDGRWMGCLVEVRGETTAAVDPRGHFELDEASLPARVRLVCVGRRSPSLTIRALPAELEPDSRPGVRRWILPQEEVDGALARLREGLPPVIAAVGALADAGTEATSSGDLNGVARAASQLRTETRALAEAVRLTERQLDGDEAAIARHAPALDWVRELDRRAEAVEELTRGATGAGSLVIVAGQVQLLTVHLAEAERFWVTPVR